MDDISATSFGFFLGGSDTSSITVTFTFYLLSIHPEIQDKLREDINTILARYNGQITYDSLNEMKYMKQVIDETMRIFPPVPILQRVCQEDYKIPGEDVIIEKGTTIFMPIIGYQHDEEYFSNPEIFDPDRFSERFGIMQTKIALTSILRKFKVTLNEKTKVPLKLDPKFALISAEGGLWLNFEKLPEIVDF
ncbi:hypothetical protein NQ314_008176 [Rhamnusium bicolor]|uniref:Cytochrome P450 n=1 Tax=Rhamnusium bicolor TaxID=1586634 RepID=A0AAV8YEF1_9CUCU|nr:hypothetical protein NQ314_008176 [Rhamnusium bicolor]